MEKGKKTEQTNLNIDKVKQTGIASRLQGHVEKITGYLNTIGENWTKIGEELTLVRDEGDYGGTFEQWVKETFGKTRDWAYKFIQGFEAKKSLPAHVEHEIQNPRQALALASAPLEKRAKIMEAVKESGKPVTAKTIEAAVKQEKAIEADVVELDELGNKIPKDILSEWNRAKDEAKEARSHVNQVSKWFSVGLGQQEGTKRDPIFRAVTMSNAKLFTDIKRQIAMVDPYAVCPTCKGSTKKDDKKCQHCKGTGFISKFEYDTNQKQQGEKKKSNAKPKK